MPMAKKVKLTGTWVLNESKSDFGDYGRMWASNKLIIIQKRKTLSMERFSSGPSGEEYNALENYTLDGMECENSFGDQMKKTSTVTWSEDKQSLTINSKLDIEAEGQQMTIDTIEILSLQDDGNTLVIKGTAMTDFGDMVVEFIYDLQ
ncbi:MAG: hypothetical protein AMS27_04090 [Bacteroides sp. SM23_62_1]|nr:MAG: hypothetical protein AMS27_04090 [Bacteroides sp. SM23_62_1]